MRDQARPIWSAVVTIAAVLGLAGIVSVQGAEKASAEEIDGLAGASFGTVGVRPFINSAYADKPVEPKRFSPVPQGGEGVLWSGQINNYVREISWTSWGRAEAVGTGQVSLLQGTASDRSHAKTSPVTVTLGGVDRCVGWPVYTTYSLQLSPGATPPEGWPKGQSGTFPCRDKDVMIENYDGSSGNRDAACHFMGLHLPNSKTQGPPAPWNPAIPGGTGSLCYLKWKAWGSRVTTASGVRALSIRGGKEKRWPIRLTLRGSTWCPSMGQSSAQGAAMTYGTLEMTLYGSGEIVKKGQRFAPIRNKGKMTTYRQNVVPSIRSCQLGAEVVNPIYDPTN